MYLPHGMSIILLLPRLKRNDRLRAGLQVLELDHAVWVPGFQELCALQRDILPVAMGTHLGLATSAPSVAKAAAMQCGMNIYPRNNASARTGICPHRRPLHVGIVLYFAFWVDFINPTSARLFRRVKCCPRQLDCYVGDLQSRQGVGNL